MNLIDNGIREVIKVKKVIKEEEMYFEVEFIDWYSLFPRKKRFNNIKNLKKKTWKE